MLPTSSHPCRYSPMHRVSFVTTKIPIQCIGDSLPRQDYGTDPADRVMWTMFFAAKLCGQLSTLWMCFDLLVGRMNFNTRFGRHCHQLNLEDRKECQSGQPGLEGGRNKHQDMLSVVLL